MGHTILSYFEPLSKGKKKVKKKKKATTSDLLHSHGQTDRHTDLNFGMEVKWKNI